MPAFEYEPNAFYSRPGAFDFSELCNRAIDGYLDIWLAQVDPEICEGEQVYLFGPRLLGRQVLYATAAAHGVIATSFQDRVPIQTALAEQRVAQLPPELLKLERAA